MLADCWINIVGPHALQNTLLASFIENETEAQCDVQETVNSSSIKLKFTHKPTLTLIDSYNEDIDKALLALTMCQETGPTEHLIAFINVVEGSPLETLVTPPNVRGIFFEKTSKQNFIKGIVAIFNGDLWFPRRLLSSYLMPGKELSPSLSIAKEHGLLTEREIQILNLLTTGAKNSEIANDLCLSVHTIKTHIYNIYKKLDVENRTQAVRWVSNNM